MYPIIAVATTSTRRRSTCLGLLGVGNRVAKRCGSGRASSEVSRLSTVASLRPAHHGYLHQDVVTALAVARLLLPRTTDHSAVSDQKVVEKDCFDDVSLQGLRTRRVQIKAHTGGDRALALADLTTKRIDFRIDRAIASFASDPSPADEYVLHVTFGSPDEDFKKFAQPAADGEPLLPGLGTQHFRLDVDAIWPLDDGPVWKHLDGFERSTVADFCDRFTIEAGCPASSSDLRDPGPMESALLVFLQDGIGVGHPPNSRRDLGDAAAHLIHLARTMRESGERVTASDVLTALALQVDYGRVEEQLPIDSDRLVGRPSELENLIGDLVDTRRLVITGPPGAGKSWLLQLLRERLRSEGWVVAVHFCFVDLLDQARERRTTIDTVFGSLIAELLDADPTLATEKVPRYAAGPVELEGILREGADQSPDRRIAIIVDGLDHADRVLLGGMPGAAADIAQELSALDLPENVVLIIGSQPGLHLGVLAGSTVHPVEPWSETELRTLAERAGVNLALEAGAQDVDPVIDVIADRARGNPLYATYLCRTAVQLVHGDISAGEHADIAEFLQSAPPFDSDLDAYYAWLLEAVKSDTGSVMVAQLLSMLDFAVTAEEIGEIYPHFAHLVTAVLARIAPVLTEDAAVGGVRVYHESFQRYVREQLQADGTGALEAVAAPAVAWLSDRGFFSDKRAFRSLLGLLRSIGHDADVLAHVDKTFVHRAAAAGQPGDAVMANLAVAAASAAALRSWPALAMLVEVARSADYLYNWRLDVEDDLAAAYGQTFASIFGPADLADRLLHEGRCTFRPRPGLLLCRLCEEHGVAPPWEEYVAAYEHERRNHDTSYGNGEAAVELARCMGSLRIAGMPAATGLVDQWLTTADGPPVHCFDLAALHGQLFGYEALVDLLDVVENAEARSWAHLAAAMYAPDEAARCGHANAALDEGIPLHGVRDALALGADPVRASPHAGALNGLTAEVGTREVRLQDDLMERWLTALDLAWSTGDQASLFSAESLIPSDTWYHRWLRLAVALRRDLETDDLLSELEGLSVDINPFQGDPRVCDLYPVHDDIRASFRKVLLDLEDHDWCVAADYLARLSTGTTTWLQGSRSGPLPLDELLDLLMETSDSERKGQKAADLASELLAPSERSGAYYDAHAEEQMLLARLRIAAGDRSGAIAAWDEACLYLAAYGWRKDTTVYELLDPLDALGHALPDQTSALLGQVQPVVEAVLVHTDGKETRHAVHRWIDVAARLDAEGALFHIARQTLRAGPSFGALQHAMPIALEALTGRVRDDALAAAWVAAGAEVRSRGARALETIERVPGAPGWSAIVAAGAGDGQSPTDDFPGTVAASASRLGREIPAIPEAEHGGDSTERQDAVPKVASEGITVDLSPDMEPLQLAHEVRRWRELSDLDSPADALAAALGERLLAFVADGRPSDAAILIKRIARDTPVWDRSGLLSGMASALEAGGADELAAMAGTFAYTRARDGWRRFGGAESQRYFEKALELDSNRAWATLADEVADGVVSGGDTGVNAHLVELLVAGEKVPDALAAWYAACEVVLERVPSVGAADEIEVLYETDPPRGLSAVACAMVARLNLVLIDERRAALGGVALLASLGDAAFGDALTLGLTTGTPSVVIPLLDVTQAHEPAPYSASVRAAEALRRVAGSDLVSARVLARRLLERAGETVPSSVASSLPSAPRLPSDRVNTIVGSVGRARVEPIDRIWPLFSSTVAEQCDLAKQSPELKARMQNALRRLRRDGQGRRQRLWLPYDEEVERILQEVGASIRMALAVDGVMDPAAEGQVGRLLLATARLTERTAYSRETRPPWHVPPADARASSVESGTKTVPSGDFAGWVILGHHERQLVVGDEYDKPVVARPEAWSSVVFADGAVDLQGDLPVGRGHAHVWTERAPVDASQGPIVGPLTGYDIIRDPYGVLELLMPHPALIVPSGLEPGTLVDGLALVDQDGRPALVCRSWRQLVLGTDYVDDHEYIYEGMELLATEEVLNKASSWGVGELLTLSSATAGTG